MDRDYALQAARARYEVPVWALIEQLEETLKDLARVKYIDVTDARAVGSVINSALSEAALAADLPDAGLDVVYVRDGRSNKINAFLEGKKVSFELHLCGPRGGTTKSSHQFAGHDIEREPSLPGFVIETSAELLFFIGLHLTGTGTSIARAYFKFADGVDQRMIEIHRASPMSLPSTVDGKPMDGPSGTKMTIKKTKGEQTENGSTTDQRGDAAPSSK